jgi:hypothetical protein
MSSRAYYQEPAFLFDGSWARGTYFLSLRTKTQPGSYIPAAHSYFLFLLFNSRRNGSRVLVLQKTIDGPHERCISNLFSFCCWSFTWESFSCQECPISLLKVLPLVKKKVPRAVKQDLHEERTFPDTLTGDP